eukprot:CAMPEP_0204529924 /NCGR_PEP_ID=MMETSP0661-20131031/10331_1 /ASSEMBLY_ACC=CAM_ASM_000606 /TAXON_ID=109239 /ORGANISM="Alexandrium margalefi, Strain AMGDE01CS-322" /LENGTH=161 /DNA_ID=CAMNT_0051535979 /DNA_START=72 /DNA_END=555 /DNA_ORIENTATION=+
MAKPRDGGLRPLRLNSALTEASMLVHASHRDGKKAQPTQGHASNRAGATAGSRLIHGWHRASRLSGLHAHDLLAPASGEHRHNRRLPRFEGFEELLLHLDVIFRGLTLLDEAGQIKVVLRLAALEQQAHGAVVRVGVQELVLRALHEGHVQVVRGGAQVLE